MGGITDCRGGCVPPADHIGPSVPKPSECVGPSVLEPRERNVDDPLERCLDGCNDHLASSKEGSTNCVDGVAESFGVLVCVDEACSKSCNGKDSKSDRSSHSCEGCP